MKLNEKDLIRFASSSSPIDKEGFLLKRGAASGAGFQKRWFILKGNLLFYFEKRDDKDPIGLIILENYKVLKNPSQKLSFSITFHVFNSRDYQFLAEYEEDMISWIKALEHASYDCLRKLVLELEKKLAEIVNGVGVPTQEASGATPLLDLDLDEMVPTVPVKEKALIEFSPESTSRLDVPRVTHLDDEMREDEEGGPPPFRVCSETDLTSPLKDTLLNASGSGSVDELDKMHSDKGDPDASLIRGSRLRGPVICVVTAQKDAKARQSQFENMGLLEDLIGEREREREKTSRTQESLF